MEVDRSNSPMVEAMAEDKPIPVQARRDGPRKVRQCQETPINFTHLICLFYLIPIHRNNSHSLALYYTSVSLLSLFFTASKSYAHFSRYVLLDLLTLI